MVYGNVRLLNLEGTDFFRIVFVYCWVPKQGPIFLLVRGLMCALLPRVYSKNKKNKRKRDVRSPEVIKDQELKGARRDERAVGSRKNSETGLWPYKRSPRGNR